MAAPIKQIQVGDTNYNIRGYFYGTCASAYDEADKVVVCPEFSSTDLVDSTILVINFAEELDWSETGDMTLNVNSTGAKSLKCFSNGSLSANITLNSSSPVLCIYSTSQDCWMLIGPSLDRNTTYSAPTVDRIQGWTINRYASCSTAAATAAKTASVTNGTVTLSSGLAVYVKFTNANTANSPTLNISSKGAKNIFYQGAQITTGAEKGLLKGLCLFVYDGTQWHLICSDGGGTATDTKVEQKAAITTDGYFPIILAESTATTATTSYVNKSSKLLFNPNDGTFSVDGDIQATGALIDGDLYCGTDYSLDVVSHTHPLNNTTGYVSGTYTPAGSLTGTTSTSGTYTILTLGFSGTSSTPSLSYTYASSVGAPQ